ncbi:MAG: 30S ribosome-binding factor RbfA [Chloroflexota bacterium]|nr:30S ribosome-binding factor RbfA [Chloroflexota bacterium]
MSRRTEQVAEEIQRHIGDLLIREVQDPRIGFATVTGVEVSPDLEHARIRISIMGGEADEREAMRGLRKASGFLRTMLGRRMRMRHIPELRFTVDRSAQHAVRIGQLLEEVLPGEAELAEEGIAAERDD